MEKEENFRKNIYFCFTDYTLTVWITTDYGKFLKRWEYQTTLQVKKQQLGPDMEQLTGSKLGKEYIKAIYCHLAYLTYRLHQGKCQAG